MAMSERKICMGNLQYCWVIEDEFMYKELSITISYIIPPLYSSLASYYRDLIHVYGTGSRNGNQWSEMSVLWS